MKKEGEGWSDGYVMNVWSMKGVEANEREQRDKGPRFCHCNIFSSLVGTFHWTNKVRRQSSARKQNNETTWRPSSYEAAVRPPATPAPTRPPPYVNHHHCNSRHTLAIFSTAASSPFTMPTDMITTSRSSSRCQSNAMSHSSLASHPSICTTAATSMPTSASTMSAAASKEAYSDNISSGIHQARRSITWERSNKSFIHAV